MNFLCSSNDRQTCNHPDFESKSQPDPHGFPQPYESLRLVHQGADSEIWQVRHQQTGQLFALKRLRDGWQDKPASAVLLENEALVAKNVSSKYVTRCMDAVVDHEQPYLLTEWISGTTLACKLATDGPFSIAHLLWIARQWVLGMCDLERFGYAHGDVRPENLMLAENGECKLIDLAHATPLSENRMLVRHNFLIGPAEYMSPERMLDGDAQPVSTDLYSLGLSLYRLLNGRLPFEGDNAIRLMRQKHEFDMKTLSLSRPDAPRELLDLIERLLAKRPIQRPNNLQNLAREFIALELALQRQVASF